MLVVLGYGVCVERVSPGRADGSDEATLRTNPSPGTRHCSDLRRAVGFRDPNERLQPTKFPLFKLRTKLRTKLGTKPRARGSRTRDAARTQGEARSGFAHGRLIFLCG